MSELPEKQIKRLRTLIQEAETNLAAAKELLISIIGDDGQVVTPKTSSDNVAGKIIEGVFDGQMMLSPDGKNYPIPANYASKSKLVEGDLMKLTITEDGSFIYKQIGPVPRKQVIGLTSELTSATKLQSLSLKTILTQLGLQSKLHCKETRCYRASFCSVTPVLTLTINPLLDVKLVIKLSVMNCSGKIYLLSLIFLSNIVRVGWISRIAVVKSAQIMPRLMKNMKIA